MKWVFLIGFVLIASTFVAKQEGRLGKHDNVFKITDTLTQPIAIFSGKGSRYELSLAYDRSRFVIDNNLHGIIFRNPEARSIVENLHTGDQVTIWFDAVDEPQTHSYLNKINAAGLSVGDRVIADPKFVTEKNVSEFNWTFFSGIGLVFLGVIIFIYRKLNVDDSTQV